MHALRLTADRITAALGHLVLRLVLAVTRFLDWAQRRARRLRFDDEGSETTEKAVLTAIGLAVAVGLGAAITAVVNKYQGQIH
ncbi:hypothetical protein [Saccharopolyspora cebuensis]|uniref:hypothetical protein n=1 Tax=Saccharopolyspora cebuensis TaxID=418759 RepID=UPI0031E7850C